MQRSVKIVHPMSIVVTKVTHGQNLGNGDLLTPAEFGLIVCAQSLASEMTAKLTKLESAQPDMRVICVSLVRVTGQELPKTHAALAQQR